MLECPSCAAQEDAAVEEALGIRLSQLREPGYYLRIALYVAGGLQTFLALPWIFGATPLWGPTGDTAIAHLTRDGVIGLVLGLIGIAVGLNPRLAYFALSVCGVLVSLQLVAFIADRTSDKVHPVFETIHILSIVISVLVAIVAFPPRQRH
jgi:bacteriorhodopsin